MPQPSVLIADECPVFRLGLRTLLARELRGGLFAEAGSEEQFQRQLPRRHWRLAVIGLPRCVELAQSVRAQEPGAAILRISEGGWIVGGSACTSSVPGLLLRNAEIAEYIRAIKAALEGQGEKPVLTPAGEGKAKGGANTFSARERYVLDGIVRGKRIKEMATELDLDIRTVSTYKSRLMKKMGLQTDAEVIRFAIAYKLL